ncbi:rhodanese-like domain-containing protein [Christensenellaceae bacterium OttesenSCG-928-L17]|nr:rhodanese-like domain-containing protein [Christensenellaceae bacterium OttesenSCG-928-L17]
MSQSGGDTTAPQQDVAATAEDEPNQLISAEDAKELLDSGTALVLLDVRTAEEYATSHLSGAYLLPESEISTRAELELNDKSLPILVYCQSGARSASASAQLVALGYKNVLDIGGLEGWPYEEYLVSEENV